MIDLLVQFMGVRDAEIFFSHSSSIWSLPIYWNSSAPVARLSLLFGLLATGEQLTGAIQELPLPLAYLDGGYGVISGDLLDRLATTDRLHGDPGLELRAVGVSLAHWWELHQGRYPDSEVIDGTCSEKPVHLSQFLAKTKASHFTGLQTPPLKSPEYPRGADRSAER